MKILEQHFHLLVLAVQLTMHCLFSLVELQENRPDPFGMFGRTPLLLRAH